MFSNYPKEIHLKDGRQVTIQPMEKTDGDQLLEYFQSFRPEDKLFMRDDVTNPKVIQKWVDDLDYEYVVPLLAFYEGKIVGVSSLHRNQHGWDSHVGHIRVSVRPEFQGSRLGYNLSREIFVVAQSMHIDIVIAEFKGRFFGKFKPDPVKSAVGFTHPVIIFIFRRGRFTGFRHFPCGKQHIRRPPIVAKGLYHGILYDPQRLLRTVGDTIMVRLFARLAGAQITLGHGKIFIARLQHMDVVRT